MVAVALEVEGIPVVLMTMGESDVLVPLVPITYMPVEVTRFPLELTVKVPSCVTYWAPVVGSCTTKNPLPLMARSLLTPVELMAPCDQSLVMEAVVTPVPICTALVALVVVLAAVAACSVSLKASTRLPVADLKPVVLRLAMLLPMMSICSWYASRPLTAELSAFNISFL